ncbi:hypothetical protein FQN60_008650 [Etheostoma spectabile]|uniref:Sterile alpha motif domain-containing protein 5 n=1 Tax=Etheostoma spectabile TaxID=54343 RepID=A0A5J5CNH1_9PERO|nr:hypothetical protein FQN60_008650 [Etheostoma spectabile]
MTQGPNLVHEWLSKLHLAQYVESFIDNGYDDLEVCKQIGEPDLDAIGVHIKYHRHRLLTAVHKLKDEDERKSPGYYFTLEPLVPSARNHSNREDDFCTPGRHEASCPGNHNLRFTDCNDFVTYPKLKLKVLLRDKLAKDGINLGEAPYTHKPYTLGPRLTWSCCRKNQSLEFQDILMLSSNVVVFVEVGDCIPLRTESQMLLPPSTGMAALSYRPDIDMTYQIEHVYKRLKLLHESSSEGLIQQMDGVYPQGQEGVVPLEESFNRY